MVQQEFGHLPALTAKYGAMLQVYVLKSKFTLTMMFHFVRLDNLPKLHDTTISTTSEAGGIVSDNNSSSKQK
jgi:hypothetical protein